ncbi:MAG: hypothetical protein EA369_02000 [Bradymonadales bacterium]|nr:MAG: hypothetical protein EA369_02000 [Bradymonadales bacterium]
MNSGSKVAVIGAGIAGIMASYLLQKKFQVELFESESKLGGHTNTQSLYIEGRKFAVDTGFIVFNERNYPLFTRFLSELKVPTRNSEMSFSYEDRASGFCYAGTSLNGLFANRKSLVSLRFWRLLFETLRFGRLGSHFLQKERNASTSLDEFLRLNRLSEDFQRSYLLPISAAIWSTPTEKMLAYPAYSFLSFMENHGLVRLVNRPQWKTVLGGSHEYIKKFEKVFKGRIILESPVRSIKRLPNQVEIKTDHSSRHFDFVVLAVHADQVLPLLLDPSPEEQSAFSSWAYSKNKTLLHDDVRCMPLNRRAWASWNYLQNDAGQLCASYHMNRLQGIASQKQFFVTLNPQSRIPNERVFYEKTYEHPTYTQSALETQDLIRKFPKNRRTFFVGSYLGNGFHEDAVRSSVQLADQMGIPWPL